MVHAKIMMLVMIISSLTLANSFQFPGAAAQNGTSSITEAFNDTESGISFQYPSDWVIASADFVDQVMSSEDLSNIGPSPIQLLHESLDGANLLILPETLPFPMSLEKYFEASKQQFATDPTMQMSNTFTLVSVGGVDGLKYDVLTDDGVSKQTQTQIALVKDSKAYVIAYMLGSSDPETQLAGVNSMIDSMNFQ